jgi:hypothetical protein
MRDVERFPVSTPKYQMGSPEPHAPIAMDPLPEIEDDEAEQLETMGLS